MTQHALSPGKALVLLSAILGVSGCSQLEGSQAAEGSTQSASRRRGALARESYCTKCHGGLDNRTGAPPNDLDGNTAPSFLSVGAHSAHVQAGPMAVALDCRQCHPQVADVCAPTHMNDTVDLSWGPLATSRNVTPTYDAVTGTCTNACHGAGLLNGSRTSPVWTAVGQNHAACGTCHGIPRVLAGGGMADLPSANHPSFTQGARCAVCHPETMAVSATGEDILRPNGGGSHVNGNVEGFGHEPGWYAPGTGGRHAGNQWNGNGSLSMDDYYYSCTRCHGNGWDFTFNGGSSGVSCGQCHQRFFVTQQPVGNRCDGVTTVPCTSCVFCH